MPNNRCVPLAGNHHLNVNRVPFFHLFLLLIGWILLSALPAVAAEVAVAWDPNREEDLAGYRIYWGTQSRVYPYSADVGDQTSYTVPNLSEGQIYFFAVTAYDVTQQESDYSAELAFSVPIADTDQDGISDSDELQHYGTDPNNPDTDGDTMSDGWEIAAGLDPLADDAHGDIDGDGLTNLDEYVAWLQSGNHAPDRPVATVPGDGQANLPLAPVLQTESFHDPDTGDTHLFTHWQVSKGSDFANPVFSLQSGVHLTSLPLPESLLDGSMTYYWRVKYTDNRLTDSVWSAVARFSTEDAAVCDADGDGVPDSQEIATPVDLDGNGVPDQSQADIKCLHSAVGDVQIGVQSQTDGAVVEKLESLDVSPQLQLAADELRFPLGLISFRVHVPNPGDTVAVRVLYSEPMPSGGWFKYTPADGWLDYSQQAAVSADRKSLTFFLTDGGDDDADGIANGVIVDPAGVAAGAGSSATPAADSGAGGCFIETVLGNDF
ncbi:MAG: hypothetical protein AMJ54_11100 [Deltaproteobacteria bacterium SG8_13]|nr:MAG: hypothetical protein AMJ54_11100 [Deltaproteobacteria bacterium SG8_13]